MHTVAVAEHSSRIDYALISGCFDCTCAGNVNNRNELASFGLSAGLYRGQNINQTFLTKKNLFVLAMVRSATLNFLCSTFAWQHTHITF